MNIALVFCPYFCFQIMIKCDRRTEGLTLKQEICVEQDSCWPRSRWRNVRLFRYRVRMNPQNEGNGEIGCVQMCVWMYVRVCVCCHIARFTQPSPCRWAAVYVLERGRTSSSTLSIPHLHPPQTTTPPAPRVPVRQPRLCAICISAPASAKALN